MIVLLGLSACSFRQWVPFKKNHSNTKPVVMEEVVLEDDFVEGANIINAQAFSEGGGLIVIPFTPGEGIEVTRDVDRSALMIVKGVAESLEGETSYTFLMTNEADLTDVIIEGKIVDFRVDSIFRKLFLKPRFAHLSINLTMTDHYTGEEILSMMFRKSDRYDRGSFDRLAYAIGQEIALNLMNREGEIR